VPAADAVDIGIANFAVPADQVVADATAFAHRLAALPPQAVQETKLLLNQPLRQAAVAGLGYGIAAETHSHDTPEYIAVPEQFKARSRG
jgi:enoyl-CoA hydratase/carnithine racemase